MGKKANLSEIEKVVKQFKKEADIDLVILFGSQRTEDVNIHSDVDLVLVDSRFEGVKPFQRSVGLHKHWHSDIPVDFLCYTPQEFNELKDQVYDRSRSCEDRSHHKIGGETILMSMNQQEYV